MAANDTSQVARFSFFTKKSRLSKEQSEREMAIISAQPPHPSPLIKLDKVYWIPSRIYPYRLGNNQYPSFLVQRAT